jgi:hypothetical protein
MTLVQTMLAPVQFIAYFEGTMGDLIPKLLHFSWSTTASKALSR